MQRTLALLIVSAVLLGSALTGAQAAKFISVAGEKQFDILVRDASLTDALASLFAATRGKAALELGSGVSGHLDSLSLSQVTLDEALAAMLGKDLAVERTMKNGVATYRVTNPAYLPPPAPTPAPAAVVLPSKGVSTDPFSVTLYMTSRGHQPGEITAMPFPAPGGAQSAPMVPYTGSPLGQPAGS